MLTVFAVPKAFKGHISVIQRNAITSWTKLVPRPEIILFGDEEGTRTICEELGLRHAPQVTRNKYGTPSLGDVFVKAEQLATNDLMCYVNADIILMSDFVNAVEAADVWKRLFLLIGGRTDLDIKAPLEFSGEWEKEIRSLAINRGEPMRAGSDYFVYRRGVFRQVPPFAIGRTAHDNWLIWNARSRRVPVVDATPAILAIHQIHTTASEWGQLRLSGEAEHNRRLAGAWAATYTPGDATHALLAGGIKRFPWLPYKRRLSVVVNITEITAKTFAKHWLGLKRKNQRGRYAKDDKQELPQE